MTIKMIVVTIIMIWWQSQWFGGKGGLGVYLFFLEWAAHHVHNNKKETHQIVIIALFLKDIAQLHVNSRFIRRKVFCKVGWNFIFGQRGGFGACSVFGVQNPLSPGLMVAKGGKWLHPSFCLLPFILFSFFFFQKKNFYRQRIWRGFPILVWRKSFFESCPSQPKCFLSHILLSQKIDTNTTK